VHPGVRLGPYEIVAPLGAGGMGEVYRARDTRLGREVAIKLLPAEVAGDAERVKRFEQEARATAALSHPNILALFDVGAHEGRPYLVAELLDGCTLAERIRAGELTVAKAVELGTQIAQGLAAAHERGIVHRDLKPGNVFVTKDGVVKILDFGLARLTQADAGAWDREASPTETGLTGAGSILGTVGYMAPEQVRGLPADHRSDIFALGCVLYEMLCGVSPFRRDTAIDTVAAILHEQPPGLCGTVKNLPSQLESLLTRCLEKRPEDRFQSARDLAHDLAAIVPETKPGRRAAARARRKRWRVIGLGVAAVVALGASAALLLRFTALAKEAQPTTPPKIVVLPFENLGATEDAYFAAGMTEEITSRLANVRGLGVISRTTAVEYDRKGKTVKQIGSDLDVDYVLEGSVRWERAAGRESRVRITPQLIRVADDTHVWADRYDRVLADVFAMQSDVAESAVKAMGVALLPREQNALREVSTDDLQAYDHYLRGWELLRRGESETNMEGAVEMFQRAVDRDPRFALAYAGLARSHVQLYFLFFDRSQERLARAQEAADRGVALRPDLAETHIALGQYYYQGLLDYQRALSELSTALQLQPSNSAALYMTGLVLRRQGQWADSADAISSSLELDPKNAARLTNLAESDVLARRYADADQAFARAIVVSPQWAEPRAFRARLQIQWRGDAQKAQTLLDEAAHVDGLIDDGLIAGTGLAVALVRRDFQGMLRHLQAVTPGAIDYQFSYWPFAMIRGQVHRLAGQQDLARRAFEDARIELEQRIAQDDDDARFHGSLGVAYAGLGRTEDAVREAHLGCDLMPASKDAWRALYRLEDRALVYTMVGRHGEAIAQLDDLLARSGEWTPHVLRLDPRWDPLRSNPRFQALLTTYEVKE
jgi:non-specific serine/threonine protein kinase